MCILFWTVDNHPKYRFIFASNRDEFLRRPTSRAHFWEEPHQNVLAGTDLEVHPEDESMENGTWLGITKQGRFSALTNFREQNFRGKISRGLLVRDFLYDTDTVHASMEKLKERDSDYGGFSLVHFDFGQKPVEMAYITNRQNQPITDLQPGEIYGLSNSILTKPWPKVEAGKKLFENIIKHNEGEDEKQLINSLFELLSTTQPMNNVEDMQKIFDDLQERISVPFFNFPVPDIEEPAYGTRTSTIVLIDHDDHVTFTERLWYDIETLLPINPDEYDDATYHFDLEK